MAVVGVAPAYYRRGGAGRSQPFIRRCRPQCASKLNHATAGPDLAFIDATVGLADYHLGGPACDPPPNTQVVGRLRPGGGGRRLGSELLGIPWRQVGHIKMADGNWEGLKLLLKVVAKEGPLEIKLMAFLSTYAGVRGQKMKHF
ncbi:MAG: hypothetical protein R2864_11515 [Syntrophotaleaceae bacterium]